MLREVKQTEQDQLSIKIHVRTELSNQCNSNSTCHCAVDVVSGNISGGVTFLRTSRFNQIVGQLFINLLFNFEC